MQYVYFGLVPLIVAGLLVYRGWYSLKSGGPATQLAIIIVFAVIYSLKFGIGVGLGTTVLVIIVWNLWGGAIIKDREREHAKRTAQQNSKLPADIANKSFDDYMDEINSIADSKGNK